mmetsp:Transcript_27484/g.70653  ORF Transcript_27484/g.70653 Transcript_27484/m.70653 type:complete len:207 (+) Transcript_27484:1038-1658(+)
MPAANPKILASQLECQLEEPTGMSSSKNMEPPYRKRAATKAMSALIDMGRCQKTENIKKEKKPKSSPAIPQCAPGRAMRKTMKPPATLSQRYVRQNTMRPCIRSRKPSSHSPTRLLIKMIHELCTNGDVTSPTSPSTVRGWMHSLSVSKPVRLMAWTASSAPVSSTSSAAFCHSLDLITSVQPIFEGEGRPPSTRCADQFERVGRH